jgi:GNAT superfamily N-acetyltransferase
MCFCFPTRQYEMCSLKDAKEGLQLSSSPRIGWDMTLDDWKRAITYSGHAYAIKDRTLTSDKSTIGTVAAIVFEEKVRILNMIIHPDHQRKKLATRLLKHLIRKVDPKNSRYLELEATSMGKPLYEKFGFKTDYELASFWKMAEETQEKHTVPSLNTEQELEEIIKLDKEAFGASRETLLRKIAAVAKKHILIDKENQDIKGFVMYTQAKNCIKIGPWIHRNAEGAEKLMKAAIVNISQEFPKTKMTVNVTNQTARSILGNLNFTKVPHVIYHMHKGNQTRVACNPDIYYAVWTFGLG